MNKEDKPPDKEHSQGSISLRLLGGLVIAFLLGYAAHGLAQNAIAANALSFSTPELINFVLSVLLSGASIFLAIAAIALGRFSEQAIIQRSDESIRLQNEVFQKTTDALQRIESSTGVTEKRIEDIISGRVGDLSQRIARIASEKQETEGSLKPKEIEEMIRKTLYQSLREEGVLSRRTIRTPDLLLMEEQERMTEQKRKQYRAMSTRLMKALSVRPGLQTVKVGAGEIDGTGDDLFDGVFLRQDGKKVAVIDFASHHSANLMTKGVTASLRQLQNGLVEHVYVILYGASEPLERAFANAIAIATPELRNRISFTPVAPDKIDEAAAILPILGA